MKFVCLGYADGKQWGSLTPSEQDAMIEECFAYDDQLLQSGHWLAGGQALQSTLTAKTLRWKNGEVVVTDGPFAETKEQLGGIGLLEARDLSHAVELMSRHPGLRIGPFEIRPVDEEKLKRQMAWQASPEGRSAAAAAPNAKAKTTKFACLGYIDEKRGDSRSNCKFEAMIEECTAFDAARQRDGHWISGIALQSAATAKTVRAKGGKVLVTDGPFAETKELLGGVVVNRFKEMDQAIDVLSTHPALRFGVVIEIRPIDEAMNARWEARQERFRATAR